MGTTLTEQRIRAALELSGGNRQKAADLLQVNRVTLWRAMRKFRISPAWASKETDNAA
jgi:transcriptional regulator of acetoin/glycerol metabolism